MERKAGAIAEAPTGERLKGLARRCEALSELTAVPEVTRELISIARALEEEARLIEHA